MNFNPNRIYKNFYPRDDRIVLQCLGADLRWKNAFVKSHVNPVF